jgi:hypothetical protein
MRSLVADTAGLFRNPPKRPSDMSIYSPLATRLAACAMIVAAAGLCGPAASRAQEAGYHVAAKQHLDGAVRWDYLTMDAANRHLFITRGDTVDVYDVDQERLVGSIPETLGVHGVALAPDLDRGYTSNGRANSVTVFVLSTLKVVGSVPAEQNPDAIVYDPASRRVFAANGRSGSLTPVDAVAGTALPALPLGGKPESMAVDGSGHLFVNLEDKNQLLVVDTRKLAIAQRFDLSAGCDEPAGLAIDTQSQRLFVGCHNLKMAIVDAAGGKIIDTVPIGRGSDATAYDAGAKLAFSSNGDGTLDVVESAGPARYRVRQIVHTMPRARTMALDPLSHKIYLVAAEAEAAAAGAEQKPARRPTLKPGTFTLITVAP